MITILISSFFLCLLSFNFYRTGDAINLLWMMLPLYNLSSTSRSLLHSTPVQSAGEVPLSSRYRDVQTLEYEVEKANSVNKEIILNEIRRYINNVMKDHMSEEYISVLCANLSADEQNIRPCHAYESIKTSDLKHLAWNIGVRLGWSLSQRASFIKACFPLKLKNVDVETIRLTMKIQRKCVIAIDEPSFGDYRFHDAIKDQSLILAS